MLLRSCCSVAHWFLQKIQAKNLFEAKKMNTHLNGGHNVIAVVFDFGGAYGNLAASRTIDQRWAVRPLRPIASALDLSALSQAWERASQQRAF